MAKKPKFDLEEFTKTLEIPDRVEKKPKYIELDPEIQACMGGLPGPPLGDITEIWGDSDTGKTTLLIKMAVAAQQQGIMPVVIIKEKKHRQARILMMGFDPDNAIVNLGCGNLEEMFDFMDKIVGAVNKGKLPMDVMFFVDSFGAANCKAALIKNDDGTTTTKNVHMQNALVFSQRMTTLADSINDTRYAALPHYIGMVYVNHVYDKPVKVGGQTFTKLQPRGGRKRKYVASLELSCKRVKSIQAKVNGKFLDFAFITKLGVEKNHINGVYAAGQLVITKDEIIPNQKAAINDYKKRHRDEWGDIMEFVIKEEEGTSKEDVQEDE